MHKMGVNLLETYLTKRKKGGINTIGLERKSWLMTSGISSTEIASNEKPLSAVLDGNAFESNVFYEVLSGNVAAPFSYQNVYTKATSILKILKDCHVMVEHVFVDGIEDPDKTKKKNDRHKEKAIGNKHLLSVVRNKWQLILSITYRLH